ncbi:MAG: PIN domain-containing protein [Acidimicrobiaceae bacterium]|nr:PIN domain-containing protein [Acidimicrobiaceae bacterium]
MILDAGVLVAVDRGEQAAQSFLAAALEESTVLHTSAPVVAQVWRDGSRQARLARFLGAVEVHDFTFVDARVVGGMLLRSGTSDVVDAHIVALAVRLRDSIVTADAADFLSLTSHLGIDAPRVHHW